jgi:2-polyprenyl-6-methoxyphenol hydroxylase-like FAD-dependent oxidoreductase
MQRDVLVVGGGIGGLVLARALARLGVAVTVVERADGLRALGAGISLGANAMRALGSIGIGEAVAARGNVLGVAAITDARGRTLSAADIATLTARHGPAYAFDRGSLHAALADGLVEMGIEIRCGTTVAEISEEEQGAGVTVETSDGLRRRYHAVIGADGLRSQVRSLVFDAGPPRYAGYTCWRWVGAVAGPPVATVEMWGRGLRVGLVPLGGSQVYAFLVANAPAGTWSDPEAARVGAVRARFAGFAGDAPRVLAAMGDDAERLLHHDIEEVDQRPWCRGAVGLLGDAAHAMTPNFGQGAAMAIEDAIVLARELVAHDDAAAGLRAYELRRRPRVTEIQRGARRFGAVAQWESKIACWGRDLAVRMMPDASTRRTLESIVAYVP